MKEQTLTIIASIILVVCLVLLQCQSSQINRLKDIINHPDSTVTVKTDTVYKTQTITDTVPKLIKKIIIQKDTITKDTILTKEQSIYEDTLTNNENDTIAYQAFISGYDSKLDSINVKSSHRIITVDREVIKTIKVQEKQKKVHFQPQFGFGYGLFNKKVDAYVGIGVGINL